MASYLRTTAVQRPSHHTLPSPWPHAVPVGSGKQRRQPTRAGHWLRELLKSVFFYVFRAAPTRSGRNS